MAVRRFETRERLLAAAAGYIAAEKGDQTSAHYDAELELREEILDAAARDYAEATS